MPYIVTELKPRSVQISLLDILHGKYKSEADFSIEAKGGTRTCFVENVPARLYEENNIGAMITSLQNFYAANKQFDVYDDPAYNYPLQVKLLTEFRNIADENAKKAKVREELARSGYKMLEFYDTFWIPKSNGKWRQIDNPCDQLKSALSTFKLLLEACMNGCTYHTAAFAYVKNRSAKDAIFKHAQAKTNWFMKTDLTNFFGSVTLDFIVNMMSQIFPFSEIVQFQSGKTALTNCLKLCMLNGGLPQGTPASPLITNIIMIPIDHALANTFNKWQIESKNGHKSAFVYTRYADDMQISNKFQFNPDEVEKLINSTLKQFNAPMVLNQKKTRYGSNAGANWNLGLMLNEQHKVTVGYRRKKQLKAALTHYVLDRKNGCPWELEDLQHLQGEISYIASIEPDAVRMIIRRYSSKFNEDIKAALKSDIKALSGR